MNAQNQWKLVTQKLSLMNATATTSTANLVKNLYKKYSVDIHICHVSDVDFSSRYLHGFEEFNRKLGCTMQSSPNSKSRRRTGGRSIIRERDRATPVIRPSAEKEKQNSPPTVPTPKSEKKLEKVKPAKVEKKLEDSPTKKDSKVRSERLQKKEESGIKKRLWKEESQSDNEAGPSQIIKPETPSTPEPKWSKRKAESEWSSDEEEASAKEKREKRSKPKTQEEEVKIQFDLNNYKTNFFDMLQIKKKIETPERKPIESLTPVREEKKTVVKVKSKDGDDSGSSTNGSNSTGQPVSIAKKRGRKRKESDKNEE